MLRRSSERSGASIDKKIHARKKSSPVNGLRDCFTASTAALAATPRAVHGRGMTTHSSSLLQAAQAYLTAGQWWRADSAARLHQINLGPDRDAEAVRAGVAKALNLEGWRDQATPPDGGKWLLIQACGAGFWSEVAHVLAGVLLAEITGRTPIVHWGSNSRFRAPDLGTGDAFGQFFTPIAGTSLAFLDGIGDRWPRDLQLDPPAQGGAAAPACSPIELLSRRESLVIAPRYLPLPDIADWIPRYSRFHGATTTEIFRILIAERLVIAPEIKTAADALRATLLGDAPYLSAHIRGTDKKNEVPNNDMLITSYLLWADRMMANADLPLFLATDDERFAALFRSRFGLRVKLPEATRGTGSVGVHFTPGESGYKLGVEMVIDTLLAVGGDHFVGNGLSNPSCAIALMRRQAPMTCTLLADNIWLRQDMALLLL